jgi:GTP pyrophosphokinase
MHTQRLDDAISFAIHEFRGRARKGTPVPYVTHLLSVMCLVSEYGGDEDQMIAAVLHDWLEDVPGAEPSLLEARWGARVRRLVEALTDATTHPKPPWRPRKEAYIAHLRDAPDEVKLISAADKLHNAGSIRRDLVLVGADVWSRFSVPRDETLWYYRAVVEALQHRWTHPLGDLLGREVDSLHHDAFQREARVPR